jgi:UDP-N-acetyl-D-mannosaminuronic acid dehydrogenase
VDDTRESPATEVIRELTEHNIEVRVYDPHVRHFEFELYDLESAFRGADLALLLSDHNEFKYLSPDELGKLMRSRAVFDTKNCLNTEKWQQAGFRTENLGKYN